MPRDFRFDPSARPDPRYPIRTNTDAPAPTDHLPPPIPREVVEWLERRFPNVMPTDRNITVEDIRFLQGCQAVITLIRETHDLQRTGE